MPSFVTPEVEHNAQLMTVNGDRWYIIVPFIRISGEGEIPRLDCPVVDTSKLNDDVRARIMSKHIHPHGVDDILSLLNDLVAAGAALTYSV